MPLNRAIAPAILALGFAAASSASASTVNLSPTGSGAFGSPSWYQSVDQTLNGQDRTVAAGLFRLTDGVDDVLAFCIEPDVWLRLNDPFDDEAATATSAQLELIDQLYSSAYGQVTDAESAAAFQIALWEIVTDDVLDLSAGDHVIKSSSASFDLGVAFLDGLDPANTGVYDLTTYASAGLKNGQDLVSGTLAAVPLPASLGFLMAGMAGLFGVRSRKKA